jgi:hypothetical protein
MAALIDPESIEDSLVGCLSINAQTTWSIWFLTSTALGHVQLTFGTENYDSLAEDERRDPTTTIIKRDPPETKIKDGWVSRPLTDVVKAEFVLDQERIEAEFEYLQIPNIKLTFANGADVTIPGQRGASQEGDREQRDRFLAAIRERLPF